MSKIVDIVVKVERKRGEKDGKKYDFLAYTATNKKGERSRLKFPKTVENIPKKEGIYVVSVDSVNIRRDNRLVFPTYWIQQVESYDVFIPKQVENEDF